MTSLLFRCILIGWLALAGCAASRAAETDWRLVQQSLKEQGLYFGQVDGREGPETLAAVNRFQIRKGLPVTGRVDEATLKALAERAPDTRDVVLTQSPPAPVEPPPTNIPPPGSNDANPTLLSTWYEPMITSGPLVVLDLNGIFASSSLAESSEGRKQRALVSVQGRLRERGFYNGGLDGDPGPMTQQALLNYQSNNGIFPSGAADSQTLASLELEESSLGVGSEPTRRNRRTGSESKGNIFERTGRSVKKVFHGLF